MCWLMNGCKHGDELQGSVYELKALFMERGLGPPAREAARRLDQANGAHLSQSSE
jgi:hypothetical protein